jgi:hypothetical protein
MKHPSVRELYDYWNARRGRRPAPERADIEPSAIRRVLADTFILAFDPRAGHPFRIAGTRVCALFGRELKGAAFLDLWSTASRREMRDLAAIVAHESIGLVASVAGACSGEVGTGSPPRTCATQHASAADGALNLELLLLPLGFHGRSDARVLGALAPGEAPAWLGTSALRDLTLGTHRYLGAPVVGHAAPAAPVMRDARIRHGFVVYDGGQS